MLRLFTRRVCRVSQSVSRRSWSESADSVQNDDAVQLKYEKCVNQVQLLGRIGRDAELRGSDERPVVVLSLATNTVYTKESGEKVAHVDWHRISVFRPYLRDKIAINIKKGDRIFLSGKLRYDEYRDNDNVLRRSSTILADDIVNLTKRYLREEMEASQDID